MKKVLNTEKSQPREKVSGSVDLRQSHER